MARKLKRYELWKGNQLVARGTAKEIASQTGLKENTIRRYMTPAYMEKQKQKKKADRGYTTKDITRYTKEERRKVKETRKKIREARKRRDKPPKPTKMQLAQDLRDKFMSQLSSLNVSNDNLATLEQAIQQGFELLPTKDMADILQNATDDLQGKNFYHATKLAQRVTGEIYVAIGNAIGDVTMTDIGEDYIATSEWSENYSLMED